MGSASRAGLGAVERFDIHVLHDTKRKLGRLPPRLCYCKPFRPQIPQPGVNSLVFPKGCCGLL